MALRSICAAGKRVMKKYLGILAIGMLAAACGSNDNPPAASAASVEQASSTPSTGPGFAPDTNDGTASAPADARAASNTNAAQKAPNGFTGPDSPTPSSAATPPSNVAALPAQDNAASAPDNSRVNARDKSGKTLTPMDQGPSAGDRKITQQIRQAVVKDGSLSFTAKNVKIITINGKVTLRGPVKTDAERSSIEAAAKGVSGVGEVDNQLEVKN
jgi:hyperosmotically inducible periplasmic protein